jgi:hypothetical protein
MRNLSKTNSTTSAYGKRVNNTPSSVKREGARYFELGGGENAFFCSGREGEQGSRAEGKEEPNGIIRILMEIREFYAHRARISPIFFNDPQYFPANLLYVIYERERKQEGEKSPAAILARPVSEITFNSHTTSGNIYYSALSCPLVIESIYVKRGVKNG